LLSESKSTGRVAAAGKAAAWGTHNCVGHWHPAPNKLTVKNKLIIGKAFMCCHHQLLSLVWWQNELLAAIKGG